MRNDFAACMLVYFFSKVFILLSLSLVHILSDTACFSVALDTKLIVDINNKTRRNSRYGSILSVN